mmetsp:Transcript_4064/g.5360  ORF Transcript_4064/g.5360 Transcript_4064/m.5360 type:complete len:196 (+) Transcript_4064:169-756(+)
MALGEASGSQLPMLELLVARDWNRTITSPSEFGQESNGLIDRACSQMKRTRFDMSSILKSEEERALEKELSKGLLEGGGGGTAGAGGSGELEGHRERGINRFKSSPILTSRRRRTSKSLPRQRQTVNFTADTVYKEKKSKRPTELAAPVGMTDYISDDGEVDVLAYMENLNGGTCEDGEDQGMTRARGRSRSCYK